MAKLRGPLMSLAAAGALGKAILYADPRRRPVARSMLAFPGSGLRPRRIPPTPAQTAQRARYADACAWWQGLTEPQRAAYQPAATAARINLFSAAIGAYLNTPAAPLTAWDGGATTWDAGATTWL